MPLAASSSYCTPQFLCLYPVSRLFLHPSVHLRDCAPALLPPAAFLSHLLYLPSSLWVFACHLPPLLLFLGTSESILDQNPLIKGCVQTPTLLVCAFWQFPTPGVLPEALWSGTVGTLRELLEGLKGLMVIYCRHTQRRCL